jgi:hypothetical protein
LLEVSEGEQRSYFNQLKAYPPAASISSLKLFLNRYQIIAVYSGVSDPLVPVV